MEFNLLGFIKCILLKIYNLFLKFYNFFYNREDIKSKMLLSLNDDCLRLIIRKLPLSDQIACIFVCQRLKQISTVVWQHKKKEQIRLKDFKDLPLEYPIEYVRCISPYVQALLLKDIDLSDLKNMTFPKVHTLIYINLKNQGCDAVNLLKKHFPKLTKLGLQSNFTGKNLRNLTNIEALLLILCKDLWEKYIGNIFLQLTKIKKISFLYYTFVAPRHLYKKIILCETLQEIIIDDEHLFIMHEELFKLKKLKKIVFYTKYSIKDILELIINKFGSSLHTLRIEGGNIWQVDDLFQALLWDFQDIIQRLYGWQADNFCQSIQKMIALRKLGFSKIKIRDDQLQKIAISLRSTLEEFYYTEAGFSSFTINYSGLLDIVRHCKKLKIIDVSDSYIDVNFIVEVAEIIASTDEERNQILVMHCSRTRVRIEDLETLQLPEKLQISFNCKELGWRRKIHPLTFVQCEWNTPNENN